MWRVAHHRENTKRLYVQKLMRSAHDDYIVGIPIFSHINGVHIAHQAKAECLYKQFMSVFTSDDGKHLPDKGPSLYREMDSIHSTQPGIEILPKNIGQTKATGPDELPARIQKNIDKEIAGVLSAIFQQSYEEGTDIAVSWCTVVSSTRKCVGAYVVPPVYQRHRERSGCTNAHLCCIFLPSNTHSR